MMGKPVVRGTRIRVEFLLRKLGDGATDTDLLDAYPQLTCGGGGVSRPATSATTRTRAGSGRRMDRRRGGCRSSSPWIAIAAS